MAQSDHTAMLETASDASTDADIEPISIRFRGSARDLMAEQLATSSRAEQSDVADSVAARRCVERYSTRLYVETVREAEALRYALRNLPLSECGYDVNTVSVLHRAIGTLDERMAERGYEATFKDRYAVEQGFQGYVRQE